MVILKPNPSDHCMRNLGASRNAFLQTGNIVAGEFGGSNKAPEKVLACGRCREFVVEKDQRD